MPPTKQKCTIRFGMKHFRQSDVGLSNSHMIIPCMHVILDSFVPHMGADRWHIPHPSFPGTAA